MKQASLKLNLNVKKTRKQVFLGEMEQVAPWAELVELIEPYYPEGKTGPTTVFPANHVARSFYAAMVLTVRSRYGRSLL